MAAEKTDKNTEREGDNFLGMVDAKIAALQALRASYLAAWSVGAFGQGGEVLATGSAFGGSTAVGVSGTFGGPPMELPRGALLGKSIPAAIKLYLSAIKRKQTIREIANGLREGGVETTAKNFETPVQSAIYRLREAGEVLRFKDGWALAEFYPENLRSRIAEKDSKPKKGKKKNATKAKKAAAKASAVSADAKPDGLAARVEAFLKAQGHPTKAAAVAAALGESANVVGLALGRLKVKSRVTKDADGAYSLVAG